MDITYKNYDDLHLVFQFCCIPLWIKANHGRLQSCESKIYREYHDVYHDCLTAKILFKAVFYKKINKKRSSINIAKLHINRLLNSLLLIINLEV